MGTERVAWPQVLPRSLVLAWGWYITEQMVRPVGVGTGVEGRGETVPAKLETGALPCTMSPGILAVTRGEAREGGLQARST